MRASTGTAREVAAALSPATRAACTFAAAMVLGREDAAARALEALRAARGARRLAEECALMLMLYAGYPAALEGLRVLRQAWPGRARRADRGTPARWRARGEVLCRKVYGDAYGRLLPAVRALHPDIAVWMVEHGYGRVLARPGAGVVVRELVTIAALAALGWERQLVSHVLGALRVGAKRGEVEEALALGAAHADDAARAIVVRTRARLDRAGTAPAPRPVSPRRAGRIQTRSL